MYPDRNTFSVGRPSLHDAANSSTVLEPERQILAYSRMLKHQIVAPYFSGCNDDVAQRVLVDSDAVPDLSAIKLAHQEFAAAFESSSENNSGHAYSESRTGRRPHSAAALPEVAATRL